MPLLKGGPIQRCDLRIVVGPARGLLITARLFDGSSAALICYLLEAEPLTVGELCAVREVLTLREHAANGKNGA